MGINELCEKLNGDPKNDAEIMRQIKETGYSIEDVEFALKAIFKKQKRIGVQFGTKRPEDLRRPETRQPLITRDNK